MATKCGVAWNRNQQFVTTRLPVGRIKIDKPIPHRQSAVIFYRTSAVEYLLGVLEICT